ncbi:response regulator [Polyangium spumosum]|nr:response regulator [Polyangium spumosum]
MDVDALLVRALRQSAVLLITDERGVVIHASERSAALLGASLVGQGLEALFADEGGVMADLWPTLRAGETWTGAFTRKDERAGVRWLRGVVYPVRDEAGELRFVATATPIAGPEADAANKAKSELVSSLSHELRTPLNAMLGFAQLLGRDKSPPLTAKQRGFLDHVLRGGEQLLQMIDEALGPARCAPIEARKHRALYIEDNPANVALVQELIATLETFELLTAPTAEIGIELARAEQPDIIMLDLNLPGMSGFEAIEHLHASPETRDIPVIALSASVMERDVRRAEQAGFSRYLKKPVKIVELCEALEELVAKA